MPFFEPHCYRCGRAFPVGEKAEIITVGKINSIDGTCISVTERKVLVCEALCV